MIKKKRCPECHGLGRGIAITSIRAEMTKDFMEGRVLPSPGGCRKCQGRGYIEEERKDDKKSNNDR